MTNQFFHALALAGLAQEIEKIVEMYQHSLTDIEEWSRFEAERRGLPGYAGGFVLDRCPLFIYLGYANREEGDYDFSDHPSVVAFNARRDEHDREYKIGRYAPDYKQTTLESMSAVLKRIYPVEIVGEMADLRLPFGEFTGKVKYEVKP